MPNSGTVYQRKSDGRWVAAYGVGPRGARKVTTRYAKSETEARRLLDEMFDPFDRIWSRVDTSSADGCWPWTGARSRKGYGVISMGGNRRAHAHRVVFAHFHGPIPDGMFVCHHCDNPPCVRPDHLFAGSHSDNMQDMRAKGRWRRRS